MRHKFTAVALLLVTPALLHAQLDVIGVQFRADQAFPEHDCYWDAAQYPNSCPATNPLGGTLHVFLRNNSAASVQIQDVTFAGESLADILRLHFQVVKRQPASIWLDGLGGTRLPNLLAAGEPVWYKTDPAQLAPGATSQVVVRLRQTPQLPSINIDVVHSGGTTSTSVPIDSGQPRITGVGFSPDLTQVHLYWHRSSGPAAPVSLRLDDVDVTALATTGSDSALRFAVTTLHLAQPLAPMSYHVFQGVYADGKKATAALRAWVNPFIHGTWGARDGNDGDYAAARAWFDDAVNHSINALVVQGGSDAVKSYLKTAEGRQYAADRGYGFVIESVGQWSCSNPLQWFIRDEPDAADSRVTGIPSDKMVGSLAQMAVGTGEELRAAYPAAPTVLNLDMTYKPFNWYNYGQVADVMMSDPYYQNRLREALWYYPNRIPLYSKATWVYAVSQLANSAASPNPLNIILYSCEYVDTGTGNRFPFAPPAGKRLEVYYALAGGAKGISYWWFLPGAPSNGLGAGTAAAQALWKEIGVLGAEMGTAAPLLVTGCPVDLPLQPSVGLWARGLLVGTDTIVILALNDQYYNDQQGCHYTPVPNATVGLPLPAWLSSPTVFEISARGTTDVAAQPVGGQLQIGLGTVNLTRMIVVTADPQLRSTIQQRYDQTYRARVCSIAPEVCQTTPPVIAQQPQPTGVCPGGSVTLSVAATGPGSLTYRWQKGQADLTDGGHYSGTGTPSLRVSNADAGDLAGYRCVVSNPYGSAISNPAALSLKPATTVSQQPEPRTTGPGGTVTFAVTAQGAGTLGYRWQRNQADLEDAGHYAGATTPTLTVSRAGVMDAGAYRCVVTGDCGSAPSDEAVLTISGPPIVPSDFDEDGDVDQEDFGRFQPCYSGATVPYPGGCAFADLDGDLDVDVSDFLRFQACLSGPGVEVNPACAE